MELTPRFEASPATLEQIPVKIKPIQIRKHSSWLNCGKEKTKMIYQLLLVVAVFVATASSFRFNTNERCRYDSDCLDTSHAYCVNMSRDFCRPADRYCICMRGCLVYDLFLPRGKWILENDLCTCEPKSKHAPNCRPQFDLQLILGLAHECKLNTNEVKQTKDIHEYLAIVRACQRTENASVLYLMLGNPLVRRDLHRLIEPSIKQYDNTENTISHNN
ncbi:hypothetical protein ScPMuIL_008550 [Solemya velum]